MAEGETVIIASKQWGISELRKKAQRGESAPVPRKPVIEDYLSRIAESSEKIAEANESIKLPRSEDEQRNLIIKLVEKIEANDNQIVPTPGLYSTTNEGTMRVLNELLSNENCAPLVKRQAVARLRLQHCYAVASAIPGSAKDAAPFLLQSFQQAESKKWTLEGVDFTILKELPGLNVSKAFDLLQAAHIEGVEINGRTVRLSSKDIEQGEMEAIMKILEDRLGRNKEAKKSLQLAYRIAKATLETAVWNTDLQGSDPLAEAIYFQKYREGRLNAARDRGPMITIKRIKGFGSSYFRSAQIQEKIQLPDPNKAGEMLIGNDGKPREFNKMLFLDIPRMHPAYLAEIGDPLTRIRGMRTRSAIDQDNNYETIDFNKMNFDAIKPGDYAGWLGIMVPRILTFKSMCLQTTWSPKDLTSDAIEGWIAPSDTSDPEEVLHLRNEFVIGMVGSIVENSTEAAMQGWDNIVVNGLFDTLMRKIPTSKGEVNAYLSKESVKWIKEVVEKWYNINFANDMSWMGVYRQLSKRGVV
jgi:hypothetical protein